MHPSDELILAFLKYRYANKEGWDTQKRKEQHISQPTPKELNNIAAYLTKKHYDSSKNYSEDEIENIIISALNDKEDEELEPMQDEIEGALGQLEKNSCLQAGERPLYKGIKLLFLPTLYAIVEIARSPAKIDKETN